MTGGHQYVSFPPTFITVNIPKPAESFAQRMAEQHTREFGRQMAQTTRDLERSMQTMRDMQGMHEETRRTLEHLRQMNESMERQRRLQEELSRLEHEIDALRQRTDQQRQALEELGRLRDQARDESRGSHEPSTEAKDLVRRHSRFFGMSLDEDGLAEDLSRMGPTSAILIKSVIDLLEPEDSLQVASRFIERMSDDALRESAGVQGGRALLLTLLWWIGQSSRERDRKNVERLVRALSPTHVRLLAQSWKENSDVQTSLTENNATLQEAKGGSGRYVFDEYAVAVKIPVEQARAIVADLAERMNVVLARPGFDKLTVFERRSTGSPRVGEIVDINIAGPDDGSVMLVDLQPNYFIYQTVYTPEKGAHPEWGAREFGFEVDDSGLTTFYTRGASRQDPWVHDYGPVAAFVLTGPIGGIVATLAPAELQARAWTELIQGIAEEVQRRGGDTSHLNSSAWRTSP